MKNILTISALSSLVSLSMNAAETVTQPNIIMVVVDDMGYGDFGCYGNTYHKTPNVDKLAKDGILFTDFHTNGAVSSPTRAALMTGRYQQYNGVEGVISAEHHRDCGLPPTAPTIAKILRSNGYETIMYGKWHLGYDPKFNPIHAGFDEFVGYIAGNVDYFSHIDQAGFEDWWHNDKKVKEDGYTTTLITDYAKRYIKKQKGKDKPFFLYLPYEACHGPWQGPRDEAIRSIINGKLKQVKGRTDLKEAYRDMVEAMDQCLGQLINEVEKAGIADNTLILFFSDNGGAKLSCNKPWSGGKGSLLEGGHRVSSIAYWPSKIKAGQVSDETITTVDIMPTLCELAGADIKGIPHDGQSFLSTILSGQKMPERMLFWRTGREVSAREGNWKLRVNRKTGETFLVDLSKDKAEEKNLKDQYPEKVKRFSDAIKKWEVNFESVRQFGL